MTLSLLGIDFDTPITSEDRVVVTGPVDSGEIKQSTVTFFSNGLSMTGPCTIGLGTQTFHAAQRSEVIAVASDLTTLDGEVTTLDGTVTTLSGDLTTLDGTVTTLSGDLTTLDGTVTTLSSDFTAFETDVNNRLPNGTDGFVALFDGSGLKTQDRFSQSGSDLTLTFPSAASASDTPTVSLRHDRAPSSTDRVCPIRFYADDSGGTDTEYASLSLGVDLAVNGFESSSLVMTSLFGGASTEIVKAGYGTVTGQVGNVGRKVTLGGWLGFSTAGHSLMVENDEAAFIAAQVPLAGVYFNTAAGPSGWGGYDFRTATGTSAFGVRLSSTTLNLAEGWNFVFGTTTGTKIGTSTTQKIGFFNATPITRPTAIASPTANVTSLKTAVDAIRTRLTSLGLTA